jgi:hypothetical protein
MASLMPRRISQVLTGQAVKKPMIIPICIKNHQPDLPPRCSVSVPADAAHQRKMTRDDEQ